MRFFLYKGAALAAFFAVYLSPVSAQEARSGGGQTAAPQSGSPAQTAPVVLTLGNPGPYTLVERSDFSRYDNGKYSGHVYREVRASIVPQELNEGDQFCYRGNFFVLEETLRDMRESAQGVDAVIPVSFEVFRDGDLHIDNDQGFPSLRGFPAYPGEAVRPGATWTAQGSRAVDPLNQGQAVVVPLIAEYEYRGAELYRGVSVHHITAKYGSRYQGGGAAGTFTGLRGTHIVDILLRVSDGLPLMMRDTLDETYTWPNGATVRFRGFTLTFGEGTIPLNRGTVIASLGNTFGGRPEPPARPAAAPPAQEALIIPRELGGDIDLASVPEGIKLTIRDIRFVPDSEEFLPAERPRLDLLAEALKQIPGRTFLVEGHTAAIGRPDGERELSIGRARHMVDELVRRGIPADRFIYTGWGGTKPLGDNASDEGRARNRRVEITILE
jgi:outer membrane protein OmpA-like peptidoglycan-associated protein